jgi:hypothetical protein
MPNVTAGATKSGRSPTDVAVIMPAMTIVGDSDEERHNERELVRAIMSFYGSTPNYAFIWDEAGFEGTTARIREKQKAGDVKGMAAQITDEHIATFAIESTWDGLADTLIEKYGGIATRIVHTTRSAIRSASSDTAPSRNASRAVEAAGHWRDYWDRAAETPDIRSHELTWSHGGPRCVSICDAVSPDTHRESGRRFRRSCGRRADAS